VKRGIELFVFLFVIEGFCLCQYFNAGTDPGAISWKQINTPEFQVIFPKGFESEANRLSNILAYCYGPVSKTLGHKPRKISVILHNQTVESNGFVVWAPKRVELYMIPPQDIYSQDWAEQLVLHELRHVVQIDKLNQGITGVMSLLFGQQAVGVVAGMIPPWFFEGDAVVSETALSYSGRGRVPSFEMEVKAQVEGSKCPPSYDKAIFGSYKEYVPDIYHYGYPLVAYARMKYGSDFWDKTLNCVGQNPYLGFPFLYGLYKNGKTTKNLLFKETIANMDSTWKEKEKQVSYTEFRCVNHRKNNRFVSYRYPRFAEDSVVVAEKSGIGILTTLVQIDKNGKESKLRTLGNVNHNRLSLRGSQLIWTEQIPDPRWENRSYSVIKSINIDNRKTETLTRKSRTFSPALSPDGRTIVAVNFDLTENCSLLLLNASNGDTLESIYLQRGTTLLFPEWSSDGEKIYMVQLNSRGKTVVAYNLVQKTWETILPPTFYEIGSLRPYHEWLFFTASFGENDNIFAYNLKTNKIWQVTAAKYGAFDPEISPSGSCLIYSNYTSNGYDLALVIIDSTLWKPVWPGRFPENNTTKRLAAQEGFILNDSDIPKDTFSIKPYKKAFQALNFHSWAPFYYDFSSLNFTNPSVSPGFTLLSQDKLSTTTGQFGYERLNRHDYLHAGISYAGLFPVFDLYADYGGSPSLLGSESGVSVPEVKDKALEITSRVRLPLNFSRNQFVTYVQPYISFDYRNNYWLDRRLHTYLKGEAYTDYGFSAYSYVKMTVQDVMPRLGAMLYFNFKNAPLHNELMRNMTVTNATIYLPGILPHHSMRVIYIRERQNPGLYPLPFSSSFPRGYQRFVCKSDDLWKTDYAFPIICPDARIGPLIYLKRLRSNLFYDEGSIESFKEQTSTISSYGMELIADVHLLRITYPFAIGTRLTHLPSLSATTFELLFNVNFYNF
jgi:hypothetical protein